MAAISGSNKGIGYAIVKGLCQKFDGDVYLTSRDEKRGLDAVKSLNELGYRPKFHILDVTVPESVEKLRDHIKEQYGGLDVLVNNAGIVLNSELWPSYRDSNTKVDPNETFGMRACETMKVNYFAFRDTCNILFPILRSHARVVNLSSLAGHLSRIPSKHLRDILASPDLTEEKLSQLMESFVQAAENGSYEQEGWPNRAYSVSKVGVSALSRVQQREFLEDKDRVDIVVNHVHPGVVNTGMTNFKGPQNIDEGAEAPTYFALLPENCTKPKGDYVDHTIEILDWVDGSPPPLPK